VLVVDQNDDDRLGPVLGRLWTTSDEAALRGEGVSRARNAALGLLGAELVAFRTTTASFQRISSSGSQGAPGVWPSSTH
jgi:hypothetical protein